MLERSRRYVPPTVEELAQDLAAIGPPCPPPAWDYLVGLAVLDGKHDPATCPTCTPVMATRAWSDGAHRATLHQELLPMTSKATP